MFHSRLRRSLILAVLGLALLLPLQPVFGAPSNPVFVPFIPNGTAPETPTNTDIVSVPAFDKTYSGEATYYGANGTGNCSFDASPNDLLVGAMNQTDYFTNGIPALFCGARVQITGPKGSVVVRIVDRCPECKPGDIDLSPEAFVQIADKVAGRVKMTWQIVTPEISGPVAYRIKEGSSEYWLAVQVRNHRTPIIKLEYLDAQGKFQTMARKDYNYFLAETHIGKGPYTFRVTDIYGHTLVDSGVPLSVGAVTSGKAQFPGKP